MFAKSMEKPKNPNLKAGIKVGLTRDEAQALCDHLLYLVGCADEDRSDRGGAAKDTVNTLRTAIEAALRNT